MVSIEKIKQRIEAVINREIAIAQKEIAEFEEKIYGNEQFYGLGGWYTQFNKAKERRERHIEDLEALKSAQGRAVKLETMRLYPYYCPACQLQVLLNDNRERNYMEHTIDRPVCTRPIYRSAHYTEWQVQQGSKYSRLHGDD